MPGRLDVPAAEVVQHQVRRLDRQLQLLAAEAAQRGDAEVIQQRLPGRLAGEALLLDRGNGPRPPLLQPALPGIQQLLGAEQLARGEPVQLVRKSPGRGTAADFGHGELAGGDVTDGQSEHGRVAVWAGSGHGDQVVVRLGLQHGVLEDGPGRDHPRHFPLDQPLREAGVLDLVAQGDAVAGGDEPRHVTVDRVVRDPAHRDAVPLVVSGGEGDLQHARRGRRVLAEHLVEVAQAEEEQHVRVLALDLPILFPEGREAVGGGRHGGGLGGAGAARESANVSIKAQSAPPAQTRPGRAARPGSSGGGNSVRWCRGSSGDRFGE